MRGGHKSSATKMTSRVEEMLDKENIDHSKLNQLGMRLQEKLEEIKVLDAEILALSRMKTLRKRSLKLTFTRSVSTQY